MIGRLGRPPPEAGRGFGDILATFGWHEVNPRLEGKGIAFPAFLQDFQ